MHVISRGTLRAFWESSAAYDDAQTPLVEWYRHLEKATYRTPQDLKAEIRTASILKGGRVVFNIAGNKYRVRAEVATVPGLAVCGAAYDGVGIPAVIGSARAVVASLTQAQ